MLRNFSSFLKVNRIFNLLTKCQSQIRKSFSTSYEPEYGSLCTHYLEKFSHLITTDEKRSDLEAFFNDFEIIAYETGRVPSNLTENDLKEIIDLPSHISRIRYINYLFKKELFKDKKRYRKKSDLYYEMQELHKHSEVLKDLGILYDSNTGAPVYGKWRNSYFINLNKTLYNTCYFPKLLSAVLFGQKLVFDFSYENYMGKQEIKNTAQQISFSLAINRRSLDPFDLWFVNLKKDLLENELNKKIGLVDSVSSSFIHQTSESYLDIFPNEKLVYLSPNARTPLLNFDHEAIYIIGGFVDKIKLQPLSFIKSQKEKLNCYRLPLEEYFSFKGNRVLTIDQVVKIMVLIKNTGNFYESIKAGVPSRKLKTDQEIIEEQKIRLEKIMHRKRQFKLDNV